MGQSKDERIIQLIKSGEKMAYKHGRDKGPDKNEIAINEVISKIDGIEKLCDMSVKDFADEEGYADIVAKNSRRLKTNQLRKFFGAVRLMEQKDTWSEIEPEFYLLKPRLAVSAGRGNVPKPFYNLILAAMRKVDVGTEEDKMKSFKIFVSFFESIVAYHKYHEQMRDWA